MPGSFFVLTEIVHLIKRGLWIEIDLRDFAYFRS